MTKHLFDELWSKFSQFSLLNEYKARLIYDLFFRAKLKLPFANTAEFGVFRGGITMLLAQLHAIEDNELYRGKTWAFDSFQGLPEGCEKDSGHYQTGHMIHSEVALKNTISAFNLEKHVKIVPGLFKESARVAIEEGADCFRLVHFDCDLYESTDDALYNIYDRVAYGGFLIFDDYFDQGGGVASLVNSHIRTTGELLFAGYGDQVIIVKGLKAYKGRVTNGNIRPPYYPCMGEGFKSLHRTHDNVVIDMTIPMGNESYKQDLSDGLLTPELGPGLLLTKKKVAKRILNLVDFHFAVLGIKNES